MDGPYFKEMKIIKKLVLGALFFILVAGGLIIAYLIFRFS